VSFAAPLYLLGLLAVPAAALLYALLERRRDARSRWWARQAMLPNVVRRSRLRRRLLPPLLLLAGLIFLLLGLARPQRTLAGSNAGAPTVVLAIDVSGSMAATDVRPNRIRAARALAVRFLNQLPATYPVALVTFGTTPRLVVAPTLDRGSVIAALPTAVIPRSGTAIGDAVGYAVALIDAAASQRSAGSLYRPGAVLLFTDGGQNAGGTTLTEAAVSSVVDYVPVDAVALGTLSGVVTQPLELSGISGATTQIHVPVQLSALRALARQTGGHFFEAGAALSPGSLRSVYTSLRFHVAAHTSTDELSADSAVLALALIAAGVALSGLWFGRIA
jgi:Ca-activated chloride channel family protein